MRKVVDSICDVIGQTPMLRLNRLVKYYGLKGSMLAKLEYLNPGYSKKDRPAYEMVKTAKESGELKPGQMVVELTSGNTGTGLAIVCQALGHPFVACMSEGNSLERARMMKALGAEVILVPQAEESVKGQVSGVDLKLVEKVTAKVVKERNGFWANQFTLDSSYLAHYYNTGEEMWQQSDGQIDCFVDIVGSGGTFTGCAKRLKEYKPSITCYVAEPKNAAVYSGKDLRKEGRHRVQGCGYAMADLPKLDRSLIDGLVEVSDEEAYEATRNLAKLEGTFVGISAGANTAAAIKLLKDKELGKNIVFTLNDSGLKYLSTDLFEY